MELGVGEVAKRAGVTVSALHFYEQKGLIHSGRNNGNQRRYHRHVLRRLAVIKAAQQVGLSLAEISESLSDLPIHQAPTKKQWETMAKNWHVQLQQRITNLKVLQTKLGSCIGCGCLSLSNCGLRNPEDNYGQDHDGARLFNNEQ